MAPAGDRRTDAKDQRCSRKRNDRKAQGVETDTTSPEYKIPHRGWRGVEPTPPCRYMCAYRTAGLPATHRLAQMTGALPPPCAPVVCPSGWKPRDGDLCRPHTGGLHTQPCYLPVTNLPPSFLACFFMMVLGLALICYKNRRKKPPPAASKMPDGASPAPGFKTPEPTQRT